LTVSDRHPTNSGHSNNRQLGNPQSFVAAKERPPREKDSSIFDVFPPRVSLSPVRVPAGRTLDSLPAEILDLIMTNLALDVPPSDFSPRNRDLIACMLTSRRMHRASQAVLYRRVTFPHGRVFSKFLREVERDPELGLLPWRLDLSHFNSLGFGRTRAANGATPDFTRTSFLRALELLPRLNEVLLQHHVATDTDAAVLQQIFFGLPQLRALDLCSMDEPIFVDAFSTTMARLSSSGSMMFNLQNLCLHECCTLPGEDIETLLARLPRLKMLDLHHTQTTDKALLSIPSTASLTHLNLGRCLQITGPGVVEFFQSHPAVQSLVYLNLGCDISRYRLLREVDVNALLPTLPSTLRSLGLNGAALRPNHMPTLVALSKHLEELSISYTSLEVEDIGALVCSGRSEEDPLPSTLRYIDCTGIPSLTQATLFSNASMLLGTASQPLEVIEIGQALATSLTKAPATNTRLGWTINEFGRRSWYVRVHSTPNPSRDWKMGSRWWGMHKVPVAWGDVGGFYGSKMFKA
jgi:hypothetical protein